MGTVLHLPDVPPTATDAGRWQALNGPLGVTTFGVNAVVMDPGEEIDIEHDETDSGHQEVYVVVTGRAAFRLGDARSRPGRRVVAVADPAETRSYRRSSRGRGSSASEPARAPSTPTARGSAGPRSSGRGLAERSWRRATRSARRAAAGGSASSPGPVSQPSARELVVGRLRLDALGHDLEAEIVPERDDRAHDRGVVGVARPC